MFSFGLWNHVGFIFLALGRAQFLLRSGHFVKAAVARGRGSLLVIVCFQERGEVCISPRLLPPGKASVSVTVARRRDAEDSDAQVGGDLEAHARAVPCQIQKREDLIEKEMQRICCIVTTSSKQAKSFCKETPRNLWSTPLKNDRCRCVKY